ncbi:MAG: hypothetical protein EOP23_21110, partial [Hyphomicrobiales bacterium]
MRKLVPVLAGLLSVSLPAVLPALAQSAPPATRQRAPGVPLAPRTGDVAPPPAPGNTPPRDEKRGTGDDKAQVRPDRD